MNKTIPQIWKALFDEKITAARADELMVEARACRKPAAVTDEVKRMARECGGLIAASTAAECIAEDGGVPLSVVRFNIVAAVKLGMLTMEGGDVY